MANETGCSRVPVADFSPLTTDIVSYKSIRDRHHVQILKRAHKDIPLLELTTSRAGAELGECERMIEMRQDAERRHRHWQDVLAEVKQDLIQAEMNLAGQVRKRQCTRRRYVFFYPSTHGATCINFRSVDEILENKINGLRVGRRQ